MNGLHTLQRSSSKSPLRISRVVNVEDAEFAWSHVKGDFAGAGAFGGNIQRISGVSVDA